MSAETVPFDMDYDTDSTNEYFVAGWDPYVIGLAASETRRRQADAAEADTGAEP